MSRFCGFCRKEVDDACMSQADAAIRCEVNVQQVAASLIPANPNIMGEEERLAMELREAFEEEALMQAPQMKRQEVDNTRRITYPGNAWAQKTVSKTYEAPQPTFTFDPNVLMLMKESCTTRAQRGLVDELWEKAKKLSEEYDIVYEPALKKRNVQQDRSPSQEEMDERFTEQ
jgi:hypothetical protein